LDIGILDLFSIVIFQASERQPLAIRHIDYFLLPFDAKGGIDKDKKEWKRGCALGLEPMPLLLDEQHLKEVVDNQRCYNREFKIQINVRGEV
jgi:hypothetical protein